MSWQAYVDQLLGTKNVSKAALFGHDGSLWAASPGFSCTNKEICPLVKAVSDPSPLYGSGIHIQGTRFVFLRPNSDGKGMYCKKTGQGGACIYITKQAVVVGMYDEGMQAGSCNVAVEKIGEYLVNAGY